MGWESKESQTETYSWRKIIHRKSGEGQQTSLVCRMNVSTVQYVYELEVYEKY
jgi:hypothetical protein